MTSLNSNFFFFTVIPHVGHFFLLESREKSAYLRLYSLWPPTWGNAQPRSVSSSLSLGLPVHHCLSQKCMSGGADIASWVVFIQGNLLRENVRGKKEEIVSRERTGFSRAKMGRGNKQAKCGFRGGQGLDGQAQMISLYNSSEITFPFLGFFNFLFFSYMPN